MERDFAIENHLPFYVSKVEPHFVDEETKLSAKPVVSLKSVQKSVKRRKRLLLAGAFGIASFLGMAVALLSIEVQQRRAQTAAIASAVQDENSNSREEAIQSPEAVATPEEENLLSVNSDADASIENPSEAEPVVHSRAAALAGKTPRKEAIRELSSQEPLQPVDHVVDDDQEDGNVVVPETVGPWEERRLRRVRRFERRAARQDKNRDLLRIDEIFEGSHRPN